MAFGYKLLDKWGLTLLSIVVGLGLLYFVSGDMIPSASAQSGQEEAGVVEINQAQFAELVYDYTQEGEWQFKGDKPVIVDFYAVWCGPCKRLRPRLEQLAREQKGEVIIYSIDAEKAAELSRRIGIRAFPTLLFIPVEGTPTLSEGLLSLKDLRQQADKIKGGTSR